MNDEIIYCPRCGASMKNSSRYCMKCGALNFDHPDNQSMKQYISEKEINKSNIGYADSNNNIENKVFVGGKELKEVSIASSPQVESKNYKAEILYILLISLLAFGAVAFFLDQSFMVGIYSFLIVFFSLLSVLATSNIYRKAGYSGFTVFIPFYNMYILCEMLFGKGILFLLGFVPIVNIFFSFVLLYKLGEKYGINGILSILFAPIVLLVIAFSDRVVFLGAPNPNTKAVITIIGLCFMIIYIILIGIAMDNFLHMVSFLN